MRTENYNRPWYRWAIPLFPPNLTDYEILDLGGGASEMARLVTTRGARVTLIDNDLDNVNRARELGIIGIHHDLNFPLPALKKQQFDGILLLDVIEHIWKAKELLKQITDLLKPGGFLLLSTPNVAALNKRCRVFFKGEPPFDEGYHQRFFTVRTLTRLLEQNSLEIQSSNHATMTFGLNRLYRILGRGPITLRIPGAWENLLVRHIVLLAAKRQKEIK
ncbi:methyltransferase domain-containing protein [candidate division KSB1 bacterium]|nr:methyltransferase domain-containing protein [candidate division KSB1 bacterium]